MSEAYQIRLRHVGTDVWVVVWIVLAFLVALAFADGFRAGVRVVVPARTIGPCASTSGARGRAVTPACGSADTQDGGRRHAVLAPARRLGRLARIASTPIETLTSGDSAHETRSWAAGSPGLSRLRISSYAALVVGLVTAPRVSAGGYLS